MCSSYQVIKHIPRFTDEVVEVCLDLTKAKRELDRLSHTHPEYVFTIEASNLADARHGVGYNYE